MENNENEFEYGGKIYVAKEVKIKKTEIPGCMGCEFTHNLSDCSNVRRIARCAAVERQDDRNVIFKEKV